MTDHLALNPESPKLVVAPCTRPAAVYAITNWHYSQRMPAGKLIHYGAWEHGQYIGTVIYGRGASPPLYQSFDLDPTELVELVRVALTTHTTPVTQIVAETIRQLRTTNPGLRLIVSFADPDHGHHGGIYQAGNWIYTGTTGATRLFWVRGRWVHHRVVGDTKGSLYQLHKNNPFPSRIAPPKHRYLYPLDKAMRRRIRILAQPPPAAERSTVIYPPNREGSAGSTPAGRSTPPETP